MAIGYANFEDIQRGNQQVVNSMASLGQQIAGSIENHAQTQAATAMLPALQQSYQQGMQKIAAGDPNGMSDIYGAAMTASQIPILAPMATSALNTANSAMQQSMHNIRSKAAQDAITARYAMEHGSDAMPKPMNAYQQEQVSQNKAKVETKQKTDQLAAYGELYNGEPASSKSPEGVPGIARYSEKINEAVDKGTAVDPNDIRKFSSLYRQYKQTQSAYGPSAISNPDIEDAYKEVEKHMLDAQSKLDEKIKGLPKGEDPTQAGALNLGILGKWGGDNLKSQKENLSTALQNFSKLKLAQPQGNAGGIPAAGGQTSSQALMQAVQAAKRHPDKIDIIKSRLQGAGIDPSMLDQAIKSQQTQQQSSPQASDMIPAANQTSDDVETEEEA